MISSCTYFENIHIKQTSHFAFSNDNGRRDQHAKYIPLSRLRNFMVKYMVVVRCTRFRVFEFLVFFWGREKHGN